MVWRNWLSGSSDKANIYIVGYDYHPPEPLLIEALANHPGCKKLYYIPIGKADSEKQPSRENRKRLDERSPPFSSNRTKRLYMYDLTEVLKRDDDQIPSDFLSDIEIREELSSGEALDQKVDPNGIFICRHHNLELDERLQCAFPSAFFLNNTCNASAANDKYYLPKIANHLNQINGGNAPFPHCQTIRTQEDIARFMDENNYDEAVLKSRRSIGGLGVKRIYRTPGVGNYGLAVQGSGTLHFPFELIKPSQHGELMMEWLEPTQGDIRAILLNGRVIGAYKRMPKQGKWLANTYQQGTVEAVDWNKDFGPGDREKLDKLAKDLQEEYGLRWTSIDLLAGKDGHRHVSEINVCLTDDFVELHDVTKHKTAKKERPFIGDLAADSIMQAYERHRSEQKDKGPGR